MHLYIDETGVAEKNQPFALGGVLVENKDNDKESEIRAILLGLKNKYKLSNLHAKDIQIPEFWEDFFKSITKLDYLKFVYFGTKNIVNDENFAITQEKYNVNRYYEMLTNFLEYLLFIDKKYSEKIKFIGFCSRIIKVDIKKNEHIIFKNMGYDTLNDKYLLLSDKNLYTFLFNIRYKYGFYKQLPFFDYSEKRLESIAFNNEFGDPENSNKKYNKDASYFYVVADFFLYNYHKYKEKLKLELDIIYSPIDFRYLSHAFSSYYLKDFLSFFQYSLKIKNELFQEKVKELLEDFLNSIDNQNDKRLTALINYLNEVVDQKDGNFSFVAKIGSIIEEKCLNKLNLNEKILLYSIMQKAYNHLGDYDNTGTYFDKISQHSKNSKDYENILFYLEAINRYAISLTNIFKFHEALLIMKDVIEQKIIPMKDCLADKLNAEHFSLLGKCYGTYGQLKAFLNKKGADKYFESAIRLFSENNDKEIQYSYLCHYYIDQNNQDKALDSLSKAIGIEKKEILNSNTYSLLLNGKAHHLELFLKYIYHFNLSNKLDNSFKESIIDKLNDLYSKDKLEHPYEKIVFYTFSMLNDKDKKGAIKYLDKIFDDNGVTVKLIVIFFMTFLYFKNEDIIISMIERIKQTHSLEYKLLFEEHDGYFYDIKNFKGKELVEKFREKFCFYYK